MIPQNRQDMKDWCLRALGAPVIQINIDDNQVEDAIDYALAMYGDYHYDGSNLVYYKQVITDQIKAAGCFPMPANVIGAVEVFNLGDLYSTGNFFNIQYQIALNDLYTLTDQSIVPYFMAFQHVGLLEELLVGKKAIRFNKHEGNLYLDIDWTYIQSGQYVMVKCYQVLDPDMYPAVYSDRWLLNYATALIGQRWGTNLNKYQGIALPGGVMFNGKEILAQYTAERKQLEQDVLGAYSAPIEGFMG